MSDKKILVTKDVRFMNYHFSAGTTVKAITESTVTCTTFEAGKTIMYPLNIDLELAVAICNVYGIDYLNQSATELFLLGLQCQINPDKHPYKYNYKGKSKKVIRDDLFSEIISADFTAKQLHELMLIVKNMKSKN